MYSMRLRRSLVLSAALLVGCSTAWETPPGREFKRDSYECERENKVYAFGPALQVWAAQRDAQRMYDTCMELRGYRKTSDREDFKAAPSTSFPLPPNQSPKPTSFPAPREQMPTPATPSFSTSESAEAKAREPSDEASARARRPLSGVILSRPGVNRGLGEILVSSRLESDAVVRLVDPNGRLYLAFYVRAGESAAVNDIAEGDYELVYRGGDGWTGEDFAQPGPMFRLNEALRFEDSYIVVRGSAAPTTRRIAGEPWRVVLRPQVAEQIKRPTQVRPR